MKTVDKYTFQALDNYPYWLEGTIESLDYALSYDAKNTMALGLYGRIYAEQLLDYETAKQYFQEALGVNIHSIAVYPHYIQTLLLNEDYEEASKLIDFALTIKGINKAEILLKKMLLLERMNEVKQALKLLKEVKLSTFSAETYEVDEVEKRLKAKKELLSGKKAKKSDDGKGRKKGKKK
jgi:tetratricopeptide (TPR) repeat protein